MTCEGVGADTKLDGGGDVRETRLDEEFDLTEIPVYVKDLDMSR